jgi:cytochrome d ubiquinol oxidase subunit II
MQTFWFIAIAGLWGLYFVLEGFDFGVGMLLRRVRADHHDRRVALHAIGPTWAANEVWVVVAVVAMFGAFPGWYAAWASTYYVPLVVVLVALISRNAAIELIGKRDDEAWRERWERVLVASSTAAPFCWGFIWSSALDLGVAYSVVGGLALVALCRVAGASFLALRTEESVRSRARRELRLARPVAALLGAAALTWTALGGGLGLIGWVALGVAVLAPGWRPGAAPATRFAAGCVAIGAFVVVWFAALFPAGLRGDVQLADAVAGHYTLVLLTVLTGLLLPVLLAVQAWSYWVFRERVTRAAVGAPLPNPHDALARRLER